MLQKCVVDLAEVHPVVNGFRSQWSWARIYIQIQLKLPIAPFRGMGMILKGSEFGVVGGQIF